MRKKPDPAYVVADLVGADRTLARLAEIKRTVDAEEARLNETIDKLKIYAKEHTAAVRAEAAALEAGLATFAEARKDELFGKARSKALTFGTIGFRKSSEVKPTTKPRMTWATILERIKALATNEADDPFQAAVRGKEEVNRDVLKGWPEERLATVGARIAEKDVFYYELEQLEIKEVAA